MNAHPASLVVVLAALSLVACGGTAGPPGTPPEDTGVAPDTEAPDAGPAEDAAEDTGAARDTAPALDTGAPRDTGARLDTGAARSDTGAARDVAPTDTGALDVPTDRGADVGARDTGADAGVDTGAPDAGPPRDGGAFSDAGVVAPRRMRVGPQSGARVVFASSTQRGAFWELPGGDVLTSFQTSRTPIRPGIAIYDLGYRLRRVSGTTVVPMPDAPSGTCRDDGTLRGCDVGPDPSGPSERSLVRDDGAILVLLRRTGTDGRSYPALARLDPATGMQVMLAEYTDLRSARADSAYDPPRALRLLGSGQVAVTAEMVGVPAQTLVLGADGAATARAPGFAYGERWSPFSVLLGDSTSATANTYRWWSARTGAITPAYALPAVPAGTSPPYFRVAVAPSGDLLLPGYTYTDRLLHVAPDGRVVEDRAFTPSGFLAVYPDGAYLTYERYGEGDLGYAARARTAAGPGVLLYDDATLVRDAGWSPAPRGGFRYPILLGAKRALVDEAGNAYVGFVLQTGGDSRTETYLAAFARDGRRLWGLRVSESGWGECQPRGLLSGRRLVVVCPGRYVNRFVILGE